MKIQVSFLLSIITFSVVLLAIIQLVVANRLSTSGVTLSALQEEIGHQKEQNGVLKAETARQLSLTHLSQRAKEAGFISDHRPIVLISAQAVALR